MFQTIYNQGKKSRQLIYKWMKHQGNDACLWEREGSDNNTYQRDQVCLTFESYTKEKFISIGSVAVPFLGQLLSSRLHSFCRLWSSCSRQDRPVGILIWPDFLPWFLRPDVIRTCMNDHECMNSNVLLHCLNIVNKLWTFVNILLWDILTSFILCVSFVFEEFPCHHWQPQWPWLDCNGHIPMASEARSPLEKHREFV